MDKKIETGNITDNTGHVSRNPNPASSNTPERKPDTPEGLPVTRDSNPAITDERNPDTRDPRPANSIKDEISLKDLILKMQEWGRYLLSKWLIILIAGIIGASLGLLYASFQKTVYTASLTFVLEEEKSSNLGNLGGLAAMAGFSLGGGGEGIFQGNNIFELYKSRSMLSKTLLSKVDHNDSLFIDRYIVFNELREGWNKNPQLKNISFSVPQEQFTLQHDSIITETVRAIRDNYLKVSKSDQTGLIQVETKSINESFSKDFTEALVKNVNDFYLETKTKKALENLSILQHQTDSIRKELNSAIGGVASAMDANPNANPARRSLNVPSSRRQVDVQANQAILTELVRNLELAKISVRKETPLIQVIDNPILPLKKEKFGKSKGVVYGGFLFGLIICIYFMIRKYFYEITHN